MTTARRLQWLHCFTRNERWKEELLLVREEIRRVGAWHQYEIMRCCEAVQDPSLLNEDWLHRGAKAMLVKKKKRLE